MVKVRYSEGVAMHTDPSHARGTYKGRGVDVKQVGRELGVRYVLEGSVRKAANRVRITFSF